MLLMTQPQKLTPSLLLYSFGHTDQCRRKLCKGINTRRQGSLEIGYYIPTIRGYCPRHYGRGQQAFRVWPSYLIVICLRGRQCSLYLAQPTTFPHALASQCWVAQLSNCVMAKVVACHGEDSGFTSEFFIMILDEVHDQKNAVLHVCQWLVHPDSRFLKVDCPAN